MTSTKPHPDPGPRALSQGPEPSPTWGLEPSLTQDPGPSTRSRVCLAHQCLRQAAPPGAPWAGQTVGSRKGSAGSASSRFPGTLPLAKKKTETIKQNPGPCSRIPNHLLPKLSEPPNTPSTCQSWGQALPDAGGLPSAGAPGQSGHQAVSSPPVGAARPSHPRVPSDQRP